ncbi:hypothetical protein GCM10010221_37100 [Streptomyces parvus]|nr:hypothetical protein GCM10010221_37100 [Streptomyces parvus]
MTLPVQQAQHPASAPEVQREVVTDTGPLLSFGHIPTGVKLFRSRYYGRICWTAAVSSELENHSRKPNAIGKAASRWDTRTKAFLGEPRVVTDRRAVLAMHTRVQATLPPQRRVGRSNSVDQGESESLVVAQAEGRAMLCNEDAATKVAEALGISSYCAADILATEVRDGRITRADALKHIRDMQSVGIDAGKVVRGALDFTRWRSFAP